MRYNLLILLVFFAMFPVFSYLVDLSTLPELFQEFWRWGAASSFTSVHAWI